MLPIVLVFVLVALVLTTASSQDHSTVADSEGYVGMEACSGCHSNIYASYQKTAMARASGPAIQGLIPGEFEHPSSGVHYRVYADKGMAWLTYERPGDPSVHGTRELLYFIGSGGRGRTYLFSDDGFVFESPINWYAQRRVWDMAPAYQSVRQIPMNLPAEASCLSCHTSNMQKPEIGTENKYKLPLFAHSGITCERCHGPGAAHISTNAAMLNPLKLPANRRDAICMQCHLEGSIAIQRPGKHLYDFRPGDDLSKYVSYFELAEDGSQNSRAFSQFEALAQSVCKRKSGDAMSCMSCHDPHFSPSPEEKVSFYRSKCLACHGASFGAKHHPDKPNCAQCHMPGISSAQFAHTQATDHRILRFPLMPVVSPSPPSKPVLIRFPPDSAKEDLRDLGLAWTSLAESGMESAIPEAEEVLRRAIQKCPNDSALSAATGYFEQLRRRFGEARDHYQRALELDPYDNDAATNLGVIEAQEGQIGRAISLWQQAFERAPWKSAIGMNLARVFCSEGQYDKAHSHVVRVLEFNPDLPEANTLARYLSAHPPRCTAP
ncbi:MAG: tetratricopeptide repeat protein [Candidatus Acidiferrum sp.]